MSLSYVTAVRNSRLQAVLDAIDAGSGAGKLRIYSGTRPATGGAETTVLAELALADPAGTIAGGVLTIDADPDLEDTSADATGTATWARILDSDDNPVCDLDVSESGGGGDVILDETAIVAGGTVTIATATITEGNA